MGKVGNDMEKDGFVFISYASKEMEIATKVCSFLEDNGIRCWIAPRNVNAGSNYATQIVSAIKRCSLLVLLASENTNSSGHVSNEVSIAFDNKKSIIPFKIQDFEFTDEYLYFLGRKHWIEAHGDINAGLGVLKRTVLSLTGQEDGDGRESSKPMHAAETAGTGEMPEEEQEGGRQEDAGHAYAHDARREDIVSLIIEKTRKYPYNIWSKIEGEGNYEKMLRPALDMFSETVRVFRHNRLVQPGRDIAELVVSELSKKEENCLQVQGLPGGAKNMLLQLAFYKMLDNFCRGESDKLPFYISASYYEKIPYNPDDVYGQMKNIISAEFREYFEYLENHPETSPVLFIEAIREHNVAKISPENVVFDLWRPLGRFSRICAVDVGLVKNRSRLKRVIPITGDSKGYTFVFSQVPVDDREASLKLIRDIFEIYEYDLEPEETYRVLKNLKFPVIDIFLVRMIAKEMRSSYDYSEIRLTDMYEKLALSELYGDEEKLRDVAAELYRYVFSQSYNMNTVQYNGALWSLPHKHNTYLEFMIARYFTDQIGNYREGSDFSFFGTVMTAMSNRFVVSYLKDNYGFQETLLDFIRDNYEAFDIRQKSNAAYWLGRITFNNLAAEAGEILSREFARYKPVVRSDNRNIQENCDNHFLFRSICTGLLTQGKVDVLDEYLCVVVTNDIANAVNRGAAIEYFGDNYQMAAHDAYYLDTDLSTGEQAIRILNSRIESALSGESKKFVEKDLVTMLTLLQARMQDHGQPLKFDIRPLARKALEFLELYHTRPQNIISSKLLFYFRSVEEDLKLFLDSDTFDIGPVIYNRYRGLRLVKRSQWTKHGIEDPESISEHTYSAWLMAMLFLPQENNTEGYSKQEILDMLLVHDMAEAIVGDQTISLNEPTGELKSQDEVLKKLFLKGTYPDIANLTHFYNVWTGYYNGININARTARDINLIQTVYTFCEYYIMYPEHFTLEDVKTWMGEKNNLKTEIGYQLFDRLVTHNKEFRDIVNISEQEDAEMKRKIMRR